MKKRKFTIYGFQQMKLLEIGLDNDDALILSVLKDCYASQSFEHIIYNSNKYIWIHYPTLLDYIPIIGSRAKMQRKIKKFYELGLIDRITMHEKDNKKGSYAYMKFTNKLDYLMEYTKDGLSQNEIPLSQNETVEEIKDSDIEIESKQEKTDYLKMRQGVSQNETGGISKRDSKDSSNKDSFNKDYKESVPPKNKYDSESVLLTEKEYQNLIEKYGVEDTKRLIEILDNYKLSNGKKYKSDYRAILNWVVDRLKEEKFKEKKYEAKSRDKPIQSTNYDQRKYKDEDFDSFYDNECLKKEIKTENNESSVDYGNEKTRHT